MVAWYMRRRSVVATAALIAAFALVGLPVPAGSRATSATRDLQPAAFTSVIIPADAPRSRAWGLSDDASAPPAVARRGQPYVGARRRAPRRPLTRPKVGPAARRHGRARPGRSRSTRSPATRRFYDNGTTAMRLPRGTVVRICGDGGCIERTVTDYGPERKSRVVDMYRPDFFKICGCGPGPAPRG